MRVRSHASDNKVEQQMTAMIDVVFQLLTFFVMSFQVALNEGDFSITMPLVNKPGPKIDTPDSSQLRLQLLADASGELSSLRLNATSLPTENRWESLRSQVMAIVGKPSPDHLTETEVEISCDARLKYAYVIDAITAVSSYPNGSGGYVKLIEKVKFAPPKK